MVSDIDRSLNEKFYLSDEKLLKYKDSEYLIKPVEIGVKRAKTSMFNPSISLQTILGKTCRLKDKDLFSLSIEDIKRSMFIHLLRSNRPIDLIAQFNFKNASGLFWLRKISQLIELRESYNNQ